MRGATVSINSYPVFFLYLLPLHFLRFFFLLLITPEIWKDRSHKGRPGTRLSCVSSGGEQWWQATPKSGNRWDWPPRILSMSPLVRERKILQREWGPSTHPDYVEFQQHSNIFQHRLNYYSQDGFPFPNSSTFITFFVITCHDLPRLLPQAMYFRYLLQELPSSWKQSSPFPRCLFDLFLKPP